MAMFSITSQPQRASRLTALPSLRMVSNAIIGPIAAAYRTWRRWRTENIILALPVEIRKDIGYPSAGDGWD